MADKMDDAKFESMDSMQRAQYIAELSEEEQRDFFKGVSEKDKVAWYNPDMTEEEVIQYLKDTNPDALVEDTKNASDEDDRPMYEQEAEEDTDDAESESGSAEDDEEDDMEDDGSSKSSVRKRYEKFKTEDQFIDEAMKQYERIDKIQQELEKVNGWIADEKTILKKDRKNTFAQNALDNHQEQLVDLQHQMSQVYNEAALLQTIYDSKFPESNKLNVVNSPNGKNKEMSQDDIHAMAENINNGNGQSNKQKSGQTISDPNFKASDKRYGANATGAFDVESYNRFANSFGERAAAEMNDIAEKYQAIAQVALNSYSKFDEMFHSVGLDLDKLQAAPVASGSARLSRLHRQRVALERTKGQTLDTYKDLKNPLLQQALGAVEATSVLIGETKKYTDLMEADPFLRHLEQEGAAKGVKFRLLNFAKDVYSQDAIKGAEKIEKELTKPLGDDNIEKDDSRKGLGGLFEHLKEHLRSKFGDGESTEIDDDKEVLGDKAHEKEVDEESKGATNIDKGESSDKDKAEGENSGSDTNTPYEEFDDDEDGGYGDFSDDDDFFSFGDEYEEDGFGDEEDEDGFGDEEDEDGFSNEEDEDGDELDDNKSDESPEDKTGDKPDDKSDENPDDMTDDKSGEDETGDKPDDKSDENLDDKVGEQPSNEESSDEASDDEPGEQPSDDKSDDESKKKHISRNDMLLTHAHIARRDEGFETQQEALDALYEHFDYMIATAQTRYKEACSSDNTKEIAELEKLISKDILEQEPEYEVSKTIRPSKISEFLQINDKLIQQITDDPDYKQAFEIPVSDKGKEIVDIDAFKAQIGIVEDKTSKSDKKSSAEEHKSKWENDPRRQQILKNAKEAKDPKGSKEDDGPNGPK